MKEVKGDGGVVRRGVRLVLLNLAFIFYSLSISLSITRTCTHARWGIHATEHMCKSEDLLSKSVGVGIPFVCRENYLVMPENFWLTKKLIWAGTIELNAWGKKAELKRSHVAAGDRHSGILPVSHSHEALHRLIETG